MKITKSLEHEKNVKAILALMIVALAFGILLLFNTYRENIIANNTFQLFMTLITVAMGLLVGLLFLIGSPTFTVKKQKKSK